MSYFDDQEDVWFKNDCQGNISDVDPYDPDWKPAAATVGPRHVLTSASKWKTRGQKRNAQRARAKARAKVA